jgi:hypothetical protein
MLAQYRKDKLQGLVDQGKLLWDATRLTGGTLEDEEKWMKIYKYLLEYGDRIGNYNIPEKFIITLPNNKIINLGKWLATQRYQRQNSKCLSQERLDKLQVLVDQGKLTWEGKKGRQKHNRRV